MAPGGVLLESLEVSTGATAHLFAIIAMGAAAAARGAFDAPTRGAVARLNFALFTPCFVLSLAPAYQSARHLAHGAAALAFPVAHIGAMSVLGALGARALLSLIHI